MTFQSIQDYKLFKDNDISNLGIQCYHIEPKEGRSNDINLTQIDEMEHQTPFKFIYIRISNNMKCTITHSTLQGMFHIIDSTLIIENCKIFSPSRDESLPLPDFSRCLLLASNSEIIIKNCFIQLSPNSIITETFVSEQSKIIIENSQIFSYNNYIVKHSDVTLNNVKINSKTNNSEKIDGCNNEDNYKYPLFAINDSKITLNNCNAYGIKNTEKEISKHTFIESIQSSVTINNSDFTDFKVVLESSKSSKINCSASRFCDNNMNIKLDHSGALLSDCIFENSKEGSHITLDKCSNLTVAGSVFTHSEKSVQINSTTSSELTIQKCSFLSTSKGHIISGFDTKLEIFNSYFTDVPNSFAILLQDVLKSKIESTTIENCKYGIIVCDLSPLIIKRSVLRNMYENGLLISTGSKVQGNHNYFFGAKIIIQQLSSLISKNSFFSQDSQASKSIEEIMEETYKIKQIIPKDQDKFILLPIFSSPTIDIKTTDLVNLSECMLGYEFPFTYLQNCNNLPYLDLLDYVDGPEDINLIHKPTNCMICKAPCDSLYLNSCGHYTFCKKCSESNSIKISKSKSIFYICPICKKEVTSSPQLELDEITECPICGDPLTSKSRTVFLTPCQHKFCNNCILECLARLSSSCPYCRQDNVEFHHIVPYQ